MSKKLLIIDDDLLQLEALDEILSDSGYTVFTESSAQFFENAISQHKPDLLLTDIVMPERDGYETLMAFRQKDDLNIPVIAMSAHFEYLAMAKKLGACAVVSKPIDPKQLLIEISHALNLS